MTGIKFIKDPSSYNSHGEFVAHLSKIAGETELINELKIALKMPSYFGYNWDALYDCLRDFHWINERVIVLIHDELPLVDTDVLKKYITILCDVIQDWKSEDTHSFEVIFPIQDQSLIEQLINY